MRERKRSVAKRQYKRYLQGQCQKSGCLLEVPVYKGALVAVRESGATLGGLGDIGDVAAL